MNEPVRIDTKYRSDKHFETRSRIREIVSVKQLASMFSRGDILMDQERQDKILKDLDILVERKVDNLEVTCEWLCPPFPHIDAECETETELDFQG